MIQILLSFIYHLYNGTYKSIQVVNYNFKERKKQRDHFMGKVKKNKEYEKMKI